MTNIFWALGAAIIISLIAFAGIIALAFKEGTLRKILLALVGFAAGALMGGAFFHLLPESIEEGEILIIFLLVTSGFSLFFILEKFIYWRHCHDGKCDIHIFAYLNLIGDGIHNFIDGLIIATTFIISVPLGVATSLSIIFHEIPQEMGDFAVLIHGGITKMKALFFNFLTALTAVFGVLIGYLLTNSVESFSKFLIPIAAGGFIYIAASDLVPELHKESNLKKSLTSFVLFLVGITFMLLTKIFFE